VIRDLTTIGASATSDVCIPGLPSEWAVLDPRAGLVLVRHAGRGERSHHELVVGEPLVLDGIELVVVPPRPPPSPPGATTIAELATMLAGAEAPEQAMRAARLDPALASEVSLQLACKQSSIRFTTSEPDDGPALMRINTPSSAGASSVVMSPEYQA